MSVPNTFASATSSIPLANLDANFAYYDAAFAISGSAVTFAGSITLTTGTANGVPYLNASKVLTSGAVLTFDGTTLSSTKFAGALNGTVGATTPATGVFTSLNSSGIITISIPGTGIPTNLAVNTTAGAANGMSIETRADESSGIRLVQTSTTYNTSPVTASDPPNIASAGTLVSGRGGGLNIVGANGPVRTYSGGAGTATTSVSSTGLAVTGTLSATGVTYSYAGAQIGGSGGVTWATGTQYIDTIGILGSSGSSLNQTAGIQFGDNFGGGSRQWAIYNGRNATTTAVGTLNFMVSSGTNIDAMSGTGTTVASLASTGLAVTGTLSSTLGATIQGLTVGLGAGAVATNTAVGVSALAANTTGDLNTAIGYQALIASTALVNAAANTAIGSLALTTNTSGSSNTGVGVSALRFNLSGASNSSLGRNALRENISGSYNSAFGTDALYSNTTASNNTAVGYQAGYSNVTGTDLTAIGYQAGRANTGDYNVFVGTISGYSNTSGSGVVAVGRAALYANTTGGNNSAVGQSALVSNTTGSYNTAFGQTALNSNSTASYNTAVGYQAGYSNTTTAGNVALGVNALYSSTASYNTAVGYGSGNAITTGAKNTIIGGYSGNQGGLDIRTASNYIVLSDGDGNPRGVFDASGNLLVGTTSFNYAANGVGLRSNAYSYFTATSGAPLLLNQKTTPGTIVSINFDDSGVGSISTNGTTTLYNTTSDLRLKNNIQDAAPASALIDSLRVRQFDWKKDNTHQRYGFIAQELVTVAPEAVHAPADPDEMMAVDYSKLVPLLVKELQSLRARVAQLESKP